MTDTLALELLYTRTVAQFALDGLVVPNLFGWRERTKHITNGTSPGPGNRIIWVPGNELGSGDLGKMAPPSKMTLDPNGNPRSLGTLLEVFTVYICGSDPSAPQNELAQYKITRLLLDSWLGAIYLQAYGTFSILSAQWDRSKTERQHGAMIVVVATIQAMIPDTTFALAPVDTHAEVVAKVLSQTDPQFEVDPH